MNFTLNPERIFQKFLNKEISESEIINFLIPFLESSEDIILRLKTLEILNKLKIDNRKLFNILESFLISDENELIRVSSTEIIVKSFFEEGIKSLNWVVKHSDSTLLLNKIKNLIKDKENSKYKNLSDQLYRRLNKLASAYSLDFKELQLLLDLNIKLNGKNLFRIDSLFSFIYEKNFMCTIVKGHIKEVSMSLHRKLPESIGFLTKLEHLNLSCGYLSELPTSLSNLKLLKTLDLSWNDFLYIPEVIKKLNSIEIIDMSNNEIKKLPSWIGCLKNLIFLNLEHNSIQEVPDTIKLSKKLKFFYF